MKREERKLLYLNWISGRRDPETQSKIEQILNDPELREEFKEFENLYIAPPLSEEYLDTELIEFLEESMD